MDVRSNSSIDHLLNSALTYLIDEWYNLRWKPRHEDLARILCSSWAQWWGPASQVVDRLDPREGRRAAPTTLSLSVWLSMRQYEVQASSVYRC